MKEFIQPFLDLIQKLVQPEQGTKFLITLGTEAGLYNLISSGLVPGLWGAIIMGAIAIGYFFVDYFYKLQKKG